MRQDALPWLVGIDQYMIGLLPLAIRPRVLCQPAQQRLQPAGQRCRDQPLLVHNATQVLQPPACEPFEWVGVKICQVRFC